MRHFLVATCAFAVMSSIASAQEAPQPFVPPTMVTQGAAPAKTQARPASPAVVQSMDAVRAYGNVGELRSTAVSTRGFFGKRSIEMRPETVALDEMLRSREAHRKFQPKPEQMPAVVPFSGYAPGTIVIDPKARALYLVEDRRSARRYAIAVGREGLDFRGTAKVGDKQEWPRWFPTRAMQEREPKKYGRYKDGMNGGADNPLGARAIYLHQQGRDTHIRIHGTNQPETIGSASSNGCFRMINDHVIDLYQRVGMGADVVVL